MNCIELNYFLHAIRYNWMHRYLSLNYNDFWTSPLDIRLGVNPATRPIILEWGSEEFNNPFTRCQNRFLKTILKSMKLLYEMFQTPPDTGNNRFIYQPVFRNINIQIKWRAKLRCFLQEEFGYNRTGTLSVNQCFEGITLISHENFLAKNGHIPEGAYLLLKKTLLEIFSKRGKYPPPLINKAVPKWNIENMTKLFSS